MQQCQDPRLSRFSKKSKDLLVDYINDKNNRGFRPDQFIFGVPKLIDETGVTEVEIQFKTELGWSQDKPILAYRRVDLDHVFHGAPVVIHVTEHTDAAIYTALLEQYGLLLEPEFCTIEQVPGDIVDIAPITDIPGFEAEDGEPPVEPPLAYLDNRNYVLTFKPTHLMFVGQLKIFTRVSLSLLGTTIDSLIDLRDYYKDGKFALPFVEMFLDEGTAYLTDEKLPKTRRHWEQFLYESKAALIGKDSYVADLMKQLTGDDWVAVDTVAPFNLTGAKVLYNGFVSKDYTVCDPAFNFVTAIELGPLCENLQGIFKLGYRYSSSSVPGNLPYDRSSVFPLFSH